MMAAQLVNCISPNQRTIAVLALRKWSETLLRWFILILLCFGFPVTKKSFQISYSIDAKHPTYMCALKPKCVRWKEAVPPKLLNLNRVWKMWVENISVGDYLNSAASNNSPHNTTYNMNTHEHEAQANIVLQYFLHNQQHISLPIASTWPIIKNAQVW